jgi:hypothetical protein
VSNIYIGILLQASDVITSPDGKSKRRLVDISTGRDGGTAVVVKLWGNQVHQDLPEERTKVFITYLEVAEFGSSKELNATASTKFEASFGKTLITISGQKSDNNL